MKKETNPNENISKHSPEQHDILKAEREYLNIKEQAPATGLAISGGGIRSASFGLGVMQALVNNNVLKRMDYMSTVSGGGYLGSALTWALKQGGDQAGTSPDNFPLGKRGKHRDKDTIFKHDKEVINENDLLDFIRQHGSYLAPTSSLDMVSFITVLMRSVMMSLFVYLSFLTIVVTVAVCLLHIITYLLHEYNIIYQINQLFPFLGDETDRPKWIMIFVGMVVLLFIIIKGFRYSVSTYLSSNKDTRLRYVKFLKGQISNGIMLKISLTCFVFGSLPYVTSWIEGALYLVPSSSTLFGAVVGLWQHRKAHMKEENSGIKSNILIYAGVIALYYGLLLFAYIAATRFFLASDSFHMLHPLYFILLILAALAFGSLANLNLIGPHNIFRSRLMEAFMPNKDAVKKNEWQKATEADSALMETMCDKKNPRPYHIINTNVILSNSPKVAYSGRGGDNFIISRLYCGSDATGWKETRHFQKNKTRGITLATAMATSAAALNPNAAVSGEGLTRNIMVSLLLSMLNLRLGYWTSNPSMKNNLRAPNFFYPGLKSEILRIGLSETDNHIQLSDGGHFENLALYELIRRKLGLIIVSDGAADPNFNFDDLANVVEKVRVDFGANISFFNDFTLGDILPGTFGETLYQKKYSIARNGSAIAKIKYSDNSEGVLFYLKLTMIDKLSTDVFSYKGIYPSFPHQSTSDQFFDEKQFEAYRELGYYIAWQMMDSDKLKTLFNTQDDQSLWVKKLISAFEENYENLYTVDDD